MTMLNTTVTLSDAVSITARIVRDFGPTHAPQGRSGAPGCNYTTVGLNAERPNEDLTKPLVAVCIVGQVFAHLGILRAVFSTMGGEYSTCVPTAGLWTNASIMGVEFTEEARQFLRDAQEVQDAGVAWGEALTKAFERAQDRAVDEAKRQSGLFGHLAADVVGATYVAPVTPDEVAAQNEEVRQFMRESRRINAIKVVRAETSCGLKEAKEAVERAYPLGMDHSNA